MPERPYAYYDFTLSLCPTCLRRVDAKIVFEGGRVFMLKRCPGHGALKVLISSEVDYYKRCRDTIKPGERPLRFNTETLYGCPYDCGLCPDHEQHSCLTLVEITDRCNLTCPVCYTESSPKAGRHRTLSEVEAMLDAVVANEGRPDIVQLSGGEPTIHPDFFAILDAAKARPIRHLMLNTNGVRIAADEAFAERLAGYAPGFELYLQFDSLRSDPLRRLRGQDLLDVRKRALERLNRLDLSTTLVVTLQKGVNDGEIGEIIRFALEQPCVRGVTFQPVQMAGRTEGFDPATDRLTLAETRRAILDQSGVFAEEDLLPVPCNPDALVMGYALKAGGQVHPLTRYLNPRDLLEGARNTIVYEQEPGIQARVLRLFSTARSPESAAGELKDLLCCLPSIQAPDLGYRNLFRVIVMRFIDAWDFDVRAIKRSCVHIVSDDLRLIPFETMNLFYRGDRVARLEELRRR
jgi:7,8-dihydro-6-hydroxymethylpterin dimethyltransferase